MRITVSFESTSRGKMSEAIAAATRNGAATGTEMRPLSLLANSATTRPAATSRMPPPKVVTSSTTADRIATPLRAERVAGRILSRMPRNLDGGLTGLRKLLTFPLFTAYLAGKYLSYLCADSFPLLLALALVVPTAALAGRARALATGRSWSRTRTACSPCR